MRYLILSKMKYIRGYEYGMPPKVDNGFESLEAAMAAKKALETLEQRPDLVKYVIACTVDPELKITELQQYKKAFEEHVDC